jgi:hypothetical protein
MKLRTLAARFGATALAGLLTLGGAGCAVDPTAGGEEETETDPDEIVGANAVGRNMEVQGYVLVRAGASDREITEAVRSQVRVLFGATKAIQIGLSDRDARTIDPTTFRRDTVAVVDPANPSAPAQQMLRVRYTYRDRAVVVKSLASRRAIGITTLFGNYTAYAQDVIRDCQSEHQDWGASGIWYNFEPTLASCQRAITDETNRVNASRRNLSDPDHQVTVAEVNRRFLPVTMRLTAITSPRVAYPEYHRLFEDDRFVAYSFFGIDKEDDPNDYGARNYFSFLRTMLQSQLNLRVTGVSDGANLLNVQWQGRAVQNVTYDRIIGWVLDNRDYPTEVSYADRNAFRLQLLRQWRDHFVTLGMNANVSINGSAHAVAIEIRTYYGNEEGAASYAAVRRYAQAFGDADVFQYTGHSHLGAGPLDARNYHAENFPSRYQIMMVNSCVSFNYYNQFFALHPGGTANLDTVTNGLPVYLEGSGVSSARFINALIDGRFRSYADILTSMKIDLPWERGHDANRVADGETDNQFSPTRFRMSLGSSAPAR